MSYSLIPVKYRDAYFHFIPIYMVAAVVIFWCFRLYQSVWKYASFIELWHIIAASTVASLLHGAGITILYLRMPVSYYFLGAGIQFTLIASMRFMYRFVDLIRSSLAASGANKQKALIIGAGDAGRMTVRELKSSMQSDVIPCCIIDDDPGKWNRYIDGVPIVGGKDSILESVEKYGITQILFAIPTASSSVRRDFFAVCAETDCELKALPGLYQFANGEVSTRQMRPVLVEDLLGRDAIRVDLDEIFSYLSGKRILVTGGGGSIGSELCRQIASHCPSHLIIFDIYENNAYDIEQELRREYPGVELTVIIGSVRDSRKVYGVFEKYKPEIVYHAAAHKHVPLMEMSPDEAVKNNVIGTYKTAYAAMMNGAERFVLISTDKAVNPVNVMGASKRLCEMVIQTMDEIVREGDIRKLPMLRLHSDLDEVYQERTRRMIEQGEHPCTQYVAVRFGNVLGSNGSVIPLFKKQIEAGGPVTVTHPDVIRYFMTIPEAVSLVLQASVYAWNGEIFVLDMGEPVKIDTLARNLIRMTGYRVDKDIKIVYTGLRPGEKLYEEKLMAEEGLEKTANDLIHVAKPISFDKEKFLEDLKVLAEKAYRNDPDLVSVMEEMVDTYHPAKRPERQEG
ncbi:MAG: polysaccharide biosynthesis protein [Lachnospiraceae bacterium]|nr:polysaccharide biosynthesis protein [Lachnospiraceae bacterium]